MWCKFKNWNFVILQLCFVLISDPIKWFTYNSNIKIRLDFYINSINKISKADYMSCFSNYEMHIISTCANILIGYDEYFLLIILWLL